MNHSKPQMNLILLYYEWFISENSGFMSVFSSFMVLTIVYLEKKKLNLQAKMSNMKKYHGFIKSWFIISITTCIFSYLLWALMDFDTFVGTGVTFEDLCFDIVYCSFYTLFSLWVSISLGDIFVKNKISNPRFVTHILLLLLANSVWAVAFENIFDSLWHAGNDVYWDRLYVFGLIATLLTMVNACLETCTI